MEVIEFVFGVLSDQLWIHGNYQITGMNKLRKSAADDISNSWIHEMNALYCRGFNGNAF